ncbi:unnamed protein product, partial [Pylaiella littoralis]
VSEGTRRTSWSVHARQGGHPTVRQEQVECVTDLSRFDGCGTRTCVLSVGVKGTSGKERVRHVRSFHLSQGEMSAHFRQEEMSAPPDSLSLWLSLTRSLTKVDADIVPTYSYYIPCFG